MSLYVLVIRLSLLDRYFFLLRVAFGPIVWLSQALNFESKHNDRPSLEIGINTALRGSLA